MALTSNALASDKDTLPPTDVKFVKHEAAAGKGLVQVGELGVKKAKNADVKALAESLVKDHTGANEQLATLAKTKGVDLSSVLDPVHAATVQRLEKHSGAEFDTALLSEFVSAHKKCISNFEEIAKSTKDADLKKWVNLMIPALKAHLEKAEALGPK
jgi:putative membrane protein